MQYPTIRTGLTDMSLTSGITTELGFIVTI